MVAYFAADLLAIICLSIAGDERAVAAAGFASMTQFSVTAIAIGISSGVTVLVAGANGSALYERASALSAAALRLWVLAGATGCVLYLVAVSWLLPRMHISQQTEEEAWWYLIATTPVLIPLGMSLVAAAILRGAALPRQAMWMLLSDPLVSAILDPLLVIWADMGLRGAAIAVCCAKCVPALVALVLLRRHALVSSKQERHLHLREVFQAALPSTLNALSHSASDAIIMTAISQLGDEALAGFVVIDRLVQFAFSMYFAIPYALSPIVAQNMGARKFERVQSAIRSFYLAAVLYGVMIALVLHHSADWIASSVSGSGVASNLVHFFCTTVSFLWAASSCYFVALASLSSLGRFRHVAVIGWLRATLGTIPLVLVGYYWAGPKGVLAASAAGTVGFGLISMLLAHHAARTKAEQLVEKSGNRTMARID